MTTTLIIPGLHSSGPAHWQSWFEERIASTLRVIQPDWSKPDLVSWSQRIRRDITRTTGKLVVVAHSFGALAAVQAAHDHRERIAGALLVAPADPEKFQIAGLLPQQALGFPAVVVGSTNDPRMTLDRAAHWADTWGAGLVNLGAAGHINVDSGFGPWPEGLSLLERLLRGAQPRTAVSSQRTARQSRHHLPVRRNPGSDAFANDRADVTQAAALLKAAGWSVDPPRSVTRALHQ